MANEINKYRVWCTVDSKSKYLWNEEEPTLCPNGHVVDQSKTTIVETMSDDVMKVLVEEQDLDESRRTGGRFQASTFNVPIPSGMPGEVTEKDFSYPVPICLLSAQILTDEPMISDEFEVQVSPDTIVGYCTQNPSPSGVVIDVNQTVIDNVEIGFKVELFDLTKLADLGRCLYIDEDNLQITVENTPVETFLASSPTYVMITIEMMRNFEIFGVGRLQIGDSKIGGSYIPANTPIRVHYRNSDGKAKRFDAQVEYLY